MKTFGKETLTWQDDFTARADYTGKVTASWGFHCHAANVTTLLPRIGAACEKEGFRWLKVSGWEIEKIVGTRASVKVEFGGFPDGDPFNFDTATASKFTYDLNITVNEEPIETHYRYKDLDKTEANIIRDYKLGKLDRVDDTYDFSDGTETYTIESELGKELADFLLKGFENYLKPGQIWRVSYSDDRLPSASTLNKVGKIENSVKGAPALSEGRNWLFTGISANSSGEIYTITHEYTMSGQGGWEEEIYGTA